MANEQLERIANALIKADAAGNTEDARMLAQAYREEENKSQGILGGVKEGIQQIPEGLASTARVLGGQLGVSNNQVPEPPQGQGPGVMDRFTAPEGPWYSPNSYDWSQVPDLLGMAAADYGAQGSARAIGAGVGGAVGSVIPGAGTAAGAVLGQMAGGALYNAATTFGQTAEERARNDNRTEINTGDLVAAGGVTAVNSALEGIAPGASKVFGLGERVAKEGVKEIAKDTAKQAGTEALTEATQSVAEQGLTSAGTEKGLTIDPEQIVASGVAGGLGAGAFEGSAGTVRGVSKGVGAKVEAARHDTGFSDDDSELAYRLLEAADGNRDALGNVESTRRSEGSQSFPKKALNNLRSELTIVTEDLKKYLKETNDEPGRILIDNILKNDQNMKTAHSSAERDRLSNEYGHLPEVPRILSLANQIDRVSRMTGSGDDRGGISRFTTSLDVTEPRGGRQAGPLLLMGAMGSPTAAITAAAAGVAINRSARLVDSITNRRSTAKRFVDSVIKERGEPVRREWDYVGNESSMTPILEARAEAKAAKQSEKEAKAAARLEAKQETDAERAALRQRRIELGLDPMTLLENRAQSRDARIAEKEAKRALGLDPESRIQAAQQKQANEAKAAKLREEINAQVIQHGAAIPKDEKYEGFRKWEHYTGMHPSKIAPALEVLEKAGTIPQGYSKAFREGSLTLRNKYAPKAGFPLAADAQALVRQRFNAGYTPGPYNQRPKALAQEQLLGQAWLDAHNKAKAKPTPEPKAPTTVARSLSESVTNLDAKSRDALNALAEEVSNPELTQSERESIVDARLAQTLSNPVEAKLWKEQLAPIIKDADPEIASELVPTPEQAERMAEQEFDQYVAEVRDTKPTKARAEDYGLAPEDRDTQLSTEPDSYVPMEWAEDLREAEDPKTTLDQSKVRRKGKTSLKDMVASRVESLSESSRLAANYPELATYMAGLRPLDSPSDAVEATILDGADGMLTVNGLIDRVTSQLPRDITLDYSDVAQGVLEVLTEWEDSGIIALVNKKHDPHVKQHGAVAKDDAGNPLDVVHIKLIDPDFARNYEVAKAYNRLRKWPDQDGPAVTYTTEMVTDGDHTGLPDYAQEDLPKEFAPLIEAVQSLRERQWGIDPTIMQQITEGLKSKGRVWGIRKALSGAYEGKEPSNGPMEAYSQLQFQFGENVNQDGALMYQEWSAGANGRLYSKNGVAHTQGGDLMKAALRSPVRKPPGESGLKKMLHYFGNLLGGSKQSINDRSALLFEGDNVSDLLTLAQDPFPTQEPKTPPWRRLTALIDGEEAYLQFVAMANEVDRMVSFARARHGNLSDLTDAALLRNTTVQEDLAKNYLTDYIVQLDGNNNSYQLAGLASGAENVMRSTGMLPPVDFDPSTTDPNDIPNADIYLEPGLATVATIPPLASLKLPNSVVRGLFKGAIGTLLYGTTYGTRRRGYEEKLKALAKKAPLWAYDGNPGLMSLPDGWVPRLLSPEGASIRSSEFATDPKHPAVLKVRVVKEGGGYAVRSPGSKAPLAKPFKTQDEAVQWVASEHLYSTMDAKVLSEVFGRYPEMEEYLNFARSVTMVIRDRGQKSIKVPSPDGIPLRFDLKRYDTFASVPHAGFNIGVKTGEGFDAGRGLAAFMTHQLDAYVMRETMKRAPEGGWIAFNPIHDSFGAHPSQAEALQQTALSVMQELGSGDYNLFEVIMSANNISTEELGQGAIKARVSGPFHPQPKPVPKVDPRHIPTALS